MRQLGSGMVILNTGRVVCQAPACFRASISLTLHLSVCSRSSVCPCHSSAVRAVRAQSSVAQRPSGLSAMSGIVVTCGAHHPTALWSFICLKSTQPSSQEIWRSSERSMSPGFHIKSNVFSHMPRIQQPYSEILTYKLLTNNAV